MPKCEMCRRAEALWAMQWVGGDGPEFTLLGSHYRGFSMTRVCDTCKIALEKPHTIRLVGGGKIKFGHSYGRWVIRPAGMLAWFPMSDEVAQRVGVRDGMDRFAWYDLFGRWAACVTNGIVTDIQAVTA